MDECTDVLCYTAKLRAPLQAFCARRRGSVTPPLARLAAVADADPEGCSAIRRLYSTDWALYKRHCLAV